MRRSRVRDLLLWSQAQQRKTHERWRQTLMLRNTVASALGGDTVTLNELVGGSRATRKHEAYQAFKGRTEGWAADLVTDHSKPEL